MNLGCWVKAVVKDVVEPAAFETSAVGLAFPCLSWISANGRYAYNAVMGQLLCS